MRQHPGPLVLRMREFCITLMIGLLPGILSMPAEAQGAGVVPVGVVKVEQQPVTQQARFDGRVEAINKVEVRARVKGFLEELRFQEGA
jgi:membrane fusion protein, multidrug efflux system